MLHHGLERTILASIAGTTLAALFLTGDPGCGRDPAAASQEARSPDPILGPVLVIHGEVVPHAEVKKQVVLGSAGQTVLGLAKIKIWTDEELSRRVAAGESAQDFAVTEEEIEESIQEQEAQIREQFPSGDVTLEDLVPETEKLPERVKLIELFNKLFLPDDVTKFPPATVDALDRTEPTRALLEQLRAEGQEREGNPFLDGLLFQEIHKYLEETSDIQDGEDLPVELALRVNGEDVRVDDLWKEIESRVSPVDVRKAKQWIVNMRLLREDLEQDHLWLDPEAALAKYKEHSDPYKDQMFSQENIALAFKHYPSLRAYRDFRRAYDSFRQKIQAELTPENLKTFADKRTRALIGQSLIDVDVILLSAYDFKAQRWKPDGWREAKRRAQETAQAIAADPSKWDEILEKNSDFYDAPVPASMQGQENPDRKDKGRFRSKTRNPFMGLLEESEYWQFLNGKTIADFVCFEQQVGTIANPIRGPYGYYIPRLLRRTAAPPSASLSEADLLDMADQDYTTLRMSEHVQELIRRNEVYGLD